ncbi:hypothetical protein DE146DRAFT_111459 [Phaeosphaeria sp. MPI-PUGE-AT-0046c]|nr:hypothetical protein DE146DRAFT_111459 [Phaeosphaeria sp. MPI-PUGE-AT-0046c]
MIVSAAIQTFMLASGMVDRAVALSEIERPLCLTVVPGGLQKIWAIFAKATQLFWLSNAALRLCRGSQSWT